MTIQKTIARNTSVMAAATLLSRVAGLVRDMILARLFGAGMVADAFFMAFTIPNLLRRFFAEGSLTAAFVPTFSKTYHQEGRAVARKVASACLTLLVLVLLLVTAGGLIFSEQIVGLIARGFEGVPGKLELTAHLNAIMFPYILFASVLALLTGVLNVVGHYFIPALSPLVLNLAMIVSAYLGGLWLDAPVIGLAWGVLVGGAMQVLMQIPVLIRHRIVPGLCFGFRHPAVRKVARLMLPGLFGVAVYQINVIVTRVLASFLEEGSVSYLYYGQRLFEFPQGIFIVALAQALLPSLSRQAAEGDMVALKDSLRFSLLLVIIVTLPAALGLGLCAVPVYSLFFMGGQFDYPQVLATAQALAAYAPGLLFVGVSRMLVPTFYALENTRTPVLVSFWTMLVNVLAGLILMQFLGHVGLALALTLASAFNALALLVLLRKRLGPLGLRSLGGQALRCSLASLGMGGVVYFLCALVDWSQPGALLVHGSVLLCSVVLGGGLYFWLCQLLGVSQVNELQKMVRRKLGKRPITDRP